MNSLDLSKNLSATQRAAHKTKIIFLLAFWLLFAGGPALSHADDSIASLERIVEQLSEMFPALEGYVISVDEGVLTVDLKQGQPVQKGDKLKLIHYGQEIFHPVTKKKVGRKERDKGEVEILDVRKDFSFARSITPGVVARVGDGVRSPFTRLTFLIASPKISKGAKKIDPDRLRLNMEQHIKKNERFTVPSFDLGVWLLENRLTTETVLRPGNLRKLRNQVQADYILASKVGLIKGKTVIDYKLYSIEEGTLEKQAKLLSEELPEVSGRSRGGGRFDQFGQLKGPLEFLSKHDFFYEIVDIDSGDFNGDGKKEFVIIDRSRVRIYKYDGKQFKLITMFKTPKSVNRFWSVDAADINGNGRDEIFVTNQMGSELSSFVLELPRGAKKFKAVWKEAGYYFRVIHPFDGKPMLLAQKPGYNDPFHGPIEVLKFKGGKYLPARELELPEKYGREYIIYGLNQVDLSGNKSPETIILDNNYHLRVYSSAGRTLIKSDDYYGHDPRLIDVGVQEDIAGVVRQGDPVHIRGRVELIKKGDLKYLLMPKNHVFAGGLLSEAIIVNNCSLAFLGISKEGFKPLFDSNKLKGYLAGYQVVPGKKKGDLQVHIAAVDDGGGIEGPFKKIVSTIFSYDWKN